MKENIKQREVFLLKMGDTSLLAWRRISMLKEPMTTEGYYKQFLAENGLPDIEEYMKEVLPNLEEIESLKKGLLEIVVEITEFLPDTG